MIGHIHFVDSNRRPAGLGHLPWAEISAAIRQMKYQGYLRLRHFRIQIPMQLLADYSNISQVFFLSRFL